ncbi:MAG: PAS domain-containing protein [Parvibaculum sp.]
MHKNQTTDPAKLRNADPVFTAPGSQTFCDYWKRLKSETCNLPGKLPSRSQFDPVSIPRLLPDIMLFERLEPGKFLVRLQGTAFRDRELSDRTGRIMEAVPGNDIRNQTIEKMNLILDKPCGLRQIGVELNRNGRKVLTETAAFPLANENGIPSFIVAMVSILETVGYHDGTPLVDELFEIRSQTEIPLD